MKQFPKPSQLSQKNEFLKYGLPFLLLVVVGTLGLAQLTSTRYETKPYNTRVRKTKLFKFS